MNENILVGDIGSSKSAWRTDIGGQRDILLPGYNPVAHEAEQGDKMFDSLSQHFAGKVPESIWYYGAGVVDDAVAAGIRSRLQLHFPGALIHVLSDLLGAARAAAGTEKAIVAILGTGSHAALYDGRQIIRQAQSLGYLLGDEGGGFDIGKALTQAYFYKKMPEHIAASMLTEIPENRPAFLSSIYHSPAPNQRIAALVKVAVTHREDPWMQHLLRDRFSLFIRRHIMPLAPDGAIHFVGSIGYIFAGLIRSELEMAGFSAGHFIREPIERLFDLHQQQYGFT